MIELLRRQPARMRIWRFLRRSSLADARTRARSRTALRGASGTQMPVSSPARNSRARETASRRLVLTLARTLGDQRGCHDIAAVAECCDLAIQPVAGRAGFVTKMQARVLPLQLAHEAFHRRRRRLDLAEIADLSLPAALGNRNRVLGFRHIDTDPCAGPCAPPSASSQLGRRWRIKSCGDSDSPATNRLAS